MVVLTRNAKLQDKLNQLVSLGESGNIAEFMKEFLPVDLSESEIIDFISRFQNSAEDWEDLVAEIRICATGAKSITGDQETNAIFYFVHPRFDRCDREVEFMFTNGDWRAAA